MAVERHGRVQSNLFFIFGRPQVNNPGGARLSLLGFLAVLFLVYAAHYNEGPLIRKRRIPATRIFIYHALIILPHKVT
jgi:hypothetical protein